MSKYITHIDYIAYMTYTIDMTCITYSAYINHNCINCIG